MNIETLTNMTMSDDEFYKQVVNGKIVIDSDNYEKFLSHKKAKQSSFKRELAQHAYTRFIVNLMSDEDKKDMDESWNKEPKSTYGLGKFVRVRCDMPKESNKTCYSRIKVSDAVLFRFCCEPYEAMTGTYNVFAEKYGLPAREVSYTYNAVWFEDSTIYDILNGTTLITESNDPMYDYVRVGMIEQLERLRQLLNAKPVLTEDDVKLRGVRACSKARSMQ
jgi:hypothetical protein